MNLALFDLDGTLLPGDSDHAFGEFLIASGVADGDDFRRRNDVFYADYQAGRLDIAEYVDFMTTHWRGLPRDELRALFAAYVERIIRPMLRDSARALVERHRAAGDLLAIVTATNDFVTRPIAALFGVETLIATELELDREGRVTGAISGVPAFREGKVARVDAWLVSQGRSLGDFERSVFYSDSINDLPLLTHVSHPVATNPAAALERLARERGWPVLELFT